MLTRKELIKRLRTFDPYQTESVRHLMEQAARELEMCEPVTTFEELELEALNDAILHRFLTHYRRGDCTKEQALIAACVWLSRERRRLMDARVEEMLKNVRPPDPHCPRCGGIHHYSVPCNSDVGR